MNDRYSQTPSEYAREYYRQKRDEKEWQEIAKRGKKERERPLSQTEVKKYKERVSKKFKLWNDRFV